MATICKVLHCLSQQQLHITQRNICKRRNLASVS